MVTRKALLIGSSGGYRGLNFLKGVEVDLENYRSFLCGNIGGHWLDSEITVLKDSSTTEITREVNESETDYTFISFSGHGFISSYTGTDYLCLKDKDLPIQELVSPSKKQTIVIDACREYCEPIHEKLDEVSLKDISLGSVSGDTRKLFDDAIASTPIGILLVFSTMANETAGDDEVKGGHFTYSLLQAAKKWFEYSNPGVLRLDEAFNASKEILKSTFITNQTPVLGGQSRRLTFPPFAAKI